MTKDLWEVIFILKPPFVYWNNHTFLLDFFGFCFRFLPFIWFRSFIWFCGFFCPLPFPFGSFGVPFGWFCFWFFTCFCCCFDCFVSFWTSFGFPRKTGFLFDVLFVLLGFLFVFLSGFNSFVSFVITLGEFVVSFVLFCARKVLSWRNTRFQHINIYAHTCNIASTHGIVQWLRNTICGLAMMVLCL